ncbi:MAG: AraC family transcriptional regulator [Alistipes sp.]|nr:AraC family transcriptional regulator [Rikenellaceae bacterium]MBO4992717.1 AraC family transcriptional regulator [Alistipes sp.]MBR3794162.1 AraC family transcriptional regulator [Alistipes sp.]MDO5487376.1 AraC family transcriptional regulator [Rikenellaceae bacterium]
MDESKKQFHYLIPSRTDREYGCTISTVGTQEILPHDTYPASDHPQGYAFDPARGRVLREYQLLYITKGQGTFSNEKGTFTVPKGSIILLRPGLWHSYHPSDETGWKEYFIGFDGPAIEKVIETFFPDGEQIYNIGLNRELVDLYQQALDVAAMDRPATQQLLCGIVMHMLSIANFTIRNEAITTDRLDQVVEQAKMIMHERVMQNIDLEALAAQLNVSYSWFRKIFRDYTGFPPAKYFTQIKLRHAQYLLTNTNEPIKEIAFMLSFKSTEHFYTTFKRVTGYTPNAYRKFSTPSKG